MKTFIGMFLIFGFVACAQTDKDITNLKKNTIMKWLPMV